MTKESSPATGVRAYVASHFAFELDGDNPVVGFARSVQGGGTSAQSLDFKQAANLDIWRQPGILKHGDIQLEVGMGMAPRFYQWITMFTQRTIERRNGAIVAADFNYRERARRTFTNALISSVGFPKLDATSKDAAYMKVTLVPESLAFAAGNNERLQVADGLRQPAKLWLAQNFQLAIDGFESATARVVSIEPFELKQQILEYPVGHMREPLRVPGRLEIPNISFTIPEVDAKPITDYVKKRLQDYEEGANSGAGLTGSITYISNEKTTLATIALRGLEILSAEPEQLSAQADNIHRVKVQLAVEALEFTYQQEAVVA